MAATVGLGLQRFTLLTHCECLVLTALVPFACGRLHFVICLGMALVNACYFSSQMGIHQRDFGHGTAYIFQFGLLDTTLVLLRLWAAAGPFAVALYG